jgi:arylsulfatase A-like enzyme
METLLSVLIGIGLAAACGFRVFVPFLVVSIAAMSGHLELSGGFEWMGTWYALTAFAVASGIEITSYWVPWLDNLLDTIATPAAIVAGTIIAASVVTDMSPFLRWSLAVIAGVGVAGVVQSATVALRGASTATTGGLANPVVSTAELGGSVATSVLSIAVPVVAGLLVALAVFILVTRMRRIARRGLCCLVVLVALAALPGCSSEERAPSHVILISIDTARADHFGFLGNEHMRTPMLDALAAESVVFEDCMTVASTTLSSHVSIMTGMYPHHHGTPRNGYTVHEDNVMMAEVLNEHGFHTVGFAGSFSLDERFGFAQGFDHYDQQFDLLVGEASVDQNQRRAESVTDAVIEYLDHGVPDRLFLFVHYFDPHRPYDPPPPFETLYDPAGRQGLPPVERVLLSDDLTSERMDEYVTRHHMQYGAEISYTDYHVGRLVQDLSRRGLLDDAVLVLTTDHGESLMEHEELFNHGSTVYQSVLHALCLVRLPEGAERAADIEGVVATIDILPTVLKVLGMPEPRGIDGETLPLTHEDAAGMDRVRFAEATKPWMEVDAGAVWYNAQNAHCVRSGRHKLVRVPHEGRTELYDVTADPHEQRNLLESPDSEAAALASRLADALELWRASADPLPSTLDPEQQEDTIARLRSLGYLD